MVFHKRYINNTFVNFLFMNTEYIYPFVSNNPLIILFFDGNNEYLSINSLCQN